MTADGIEAMLSIGEFARAASLSVSAVRFYGDRGVLLPAVTDPNTGYRYYSPNQIETAALVRDLRRIEMPLTEVGHVITLAPEEREAAIIAQIDRLEQRLSDARLVATQLGRPQQLAAEAVDRTVLRSADLVQAIAQVVPIAGTDPKAPHLMCVRVEVRDGSVRFVATDRYRMTIRDIAPREAGEPFAMVVAAATLGEWPAPSGADAVTLTGSDGELLASNGHVELRCPAIPVEFPDYEEVLSRYEPAPTSVVVERASLQEMLEAFGGDHPVTLTASLGELMVSRQGTESACAAHVVGPHASVAVNPRYAAEAVEHAVGSEVVVGIDHPTRPVTFRSADDGTYTSLLMPVAV